MVRLTFDTQTYTLRLFDHVCVCVCLCVVRVHTYESECTYKYIGMYEYDVQANTRNSQDKSRQVAVSVYMVKHTRIHHLD